MPKTTIHRATVAADVAVAVAVAGILEHESASGDPRVVPVDRKNAAFNVVD